MNPFKILGLATWEFVGNRIKDIDPKDIDKLQSEVSSIVGESTAAEFMDFLRLKVIIG